MVNPRFKNPSLFILFLYSMTSFGCFGGSSHVDRTEQKVTLVGDMNSPFGRMMRLCMDMAISDFYSAPSHHKTRLQLSTMDAKTVLDFNLAVLESAKRGEVVGILQPQGSSEEEAFAAAVGESFHVPIISFTATSSARRYAENSYLVRATLDDEVQARALAALCQKFEWSKVVILYEDTGYSNHFLSNTIKSFQDVDIELARMSPIATFAEDGDILQELYELEKEQTQVFVVHMNPALGHRLLKLADGAGMMSEGYAWIVTDSLSIFKNSTNFNPDGSMDGVLGIRPHTFASKNQESFRQKWKNNLPVDKMNTPVMELNVYGLWAYDAITALAVAVEEIGMRNSSSSYGSMLLSKLLTTKVLLTGNFQLVAGKLKPLAYEIINIIGSKENRVGVWTPERGIIREFHEVKNIVWPGYSAIRPKGWRVPATGILRVGIPCKPGFKEFVNGVFDPVRNTTNASGFAIEIFLKALEVLPFTNHKFHCYNISISEHRTYDTMLQEIPREYDMVVGDVTIWSPRTEYVDFSLPYSESGVVLVIKNRKPSDMWIFIRPLRWDLWLAILVSCIFMGVALRILERRANDTDDQTIRAHPDRPGSVYWSPIVVLAFPERKMVTNNWSVFTLICWLFMGYILMQSFTASLAAILTVDQLKFAFSEDYYVGYHEGSFLRNFSIEQLHISESRLIPYKSLKEFHEAMLKGSKHGGVDAIIDVVPYMKLFLNKYEFHYKMVGPTYRTDGFGFAFPKGSPMVAQFSRAILNITQGPEMSNLERKNFGPGYSSQDPMSSVISQGTSSLTLGEFAGLFLIVGLLTLLALFCSETSMGRKISNAIGHFIQKCLGCRTVQVHSTTGRSGDGDGDGDPTHSDNTSNASQLEMDEIDATGLTNEAVVIAVDDDARIIESANV